MKKSVSVLIIIAFSVIAVKSFAQDTLKEGKYVTVTTYPDDEKSHPAFKHTDPVTYFKNGNSRTEAQFENIYSINIYNKRTGEKYLAVNKNGDKFVMITSPEELKKQSNNDGYKSKIELTNDTKMILGYHCKKVILTYPNDSLKHPYECWYTNGVLENPIENTKQLFGIDGFIMEITIWEGSDLTPSIKRTVVSIEKELVPDTLFNLPSGYRIITDEQLKKEREARNDSFGKGTTNFYNTFPNDTILPDITINDTSGKLIKLSSLRGNYVLVDFWASWCGPCREENPNVVKAYNKYKDKGFTVYSISLDDKKANWIKAIKHDKLEWPYHVCDFGGWYSPIVNQFKIKGIPYNYLIDKDGKIIAYNLRGNGLEEVLNRCIK